MLGTLVQAMKLPPIRVSADPYEIPQMKKHLLVIGGTHLLALADLFGHYAVEVTVLIPAQMPELDCEMEYKRGLQLENVIGKNCRGVGIVKDLSGVDSDSIDFLISSVIEPVTREGFLSDAWRVVKEFGKVGVFTLAEIPRSHLGGLGIAGSVYYPVEGLYVGTLRKQAAIRTRN